MATPTNFIDLSGQIFGRLVVIKRAPDKIKWKPRWSCICECGNTKDIYGMNLTTGNTKSCGCFAKESDTRFQVTHDKCTTPEYKSWAHAKSRCHCKTDHAFNRYGGRGITMCDKWRNSFSAFYADMGDKPTIKHSIERRNNNLGYAPENCYWATDCEQANNKRNNILLTHNGITRTISEWSEITGLPHITIYNRFRRGWPDSRTLTEKKRM